MASLIINYDIVFNYYDDNYIIIIIIIIILIVVIIIIIIIKIISSVYINYLKESHRSYGEPLRVVFKGLLLFMYD